jgi:hypothetical protein
MSLRAARRDRISPFKETRRFRAIVISDALRSGTAPRHDIAAGTNNAPAGIAQTNMHNNDPNLWRIEHWIHLSIIRREVTVLPNPTDYRRV